MSHRAQSATSGFGRPPVISAKSKGARRLFADWMFETYELFRSPILECLRRTDGRALALDPQASLGSVHRLLPHVNRVLFARRPGAIAFRTREGRFVSIDDTPTQWFVLSVGPVKAVRPREELSKHLFRAVSRFDTEQAVAAGRLLGCHAPALHLDRGALLDAILTLLRAGYVPPHTYTDVARSGLRSLDPVAVKVIAQLVQMEQFEENDLLMEAAAAAGTEHVATPAWLTGRTARRAIARPYRPRAAAAACDW
jgi:hypothetical protein